jgi:uncharacterized membrane protein YhaH (DUF805 family)
MKKLKILLLDYHGRVDKNTYIITTLILSIISFLINSCFDLTDIIIQFIMKNYLDAGQLNMIYDLYGLEIESNVNYAIAIVPILIFFIFSYFYTVLLIKRCHDRGRSAWFCLYLMIPIIGLWPLYELFILNGVKQKNKYGKNPLDKKSTFN